MWLTEMQRKSSPLSHTAAHIPLSYLKMGEQEIIDISSDEEDEDGGPSTASSRQAHDMFQRSSEEVPQQYKTQREFDGEKRGRMWGDNDTNKNTRPRIDHAVSDDLELARAISMSESQGIKYEGISQSLPSDDRSLLSPISKDFQFAKALSMSESNIPQSNHEMVEESHSSSLLPSLFSENVSEPVSDDYQLHRAMSESSKQGRSQFSSSSFFFLFFPFLFFPFCIYFNVLPYNMQICRNLM